MKKSLKDGETVCRRMTYTDRGHDMASFKAFSLGKVCTEKVHAMLNESIDDACLKCSMMETKTDYHKDHARRLDDTVVTAMARCKSVGRCIAEVEHELPIYERHMPDGSMRVEFEDSKPMVSLSPRRGGKSYMASMANEIMGAKATRIFVDDLDDDSQGLDEAVEYETQQKNYDNFGSW